MEVIILASMLAATCGPTAQAPAPPPEPLGDLFICPQDTVGELLARWARDVGIVLSLDPEHERLADRTRNGLLEDLRVPREWANAVLGEFLLEHGYVLHPVTSRYVLGEREVRTEAAQFVAEELLATAGFALDAVWGEELRALGVALNDSPTRVPRVIERDSLGAWAEHPAFEVELTLKLEDLHRRHASMFLHRVCAGQVEAFVEPKPSNRLVLRGGGRGVARAVALVEELRRKLRGEQHGPWPSLTRPRPVEPLELHRDERVLEVLRRAARRTGCIFVLEENAHWWLHGMRSRWQASFTLPADEVEVIFEEWLADHHLALIEMGDPELRLARIERIDKSFEERVPAHAPFVPACALAEVAPRAASWFITVFRFDHLDSQSVASAFSGRGPGSPHVLSHVLGDSSLLVMAGTGRELAHLHEVLSALDRAAAGR